jgi:DNA invertase Pin-like site-specific DNA recombinase
LYNTLINAPEFYKAGIYIRLSEADEGKAYESDSESVQNQRNMLMSYVKEKGFIFVGEYVDDGYSGTNFERPGFMHMIEDIKNKVINLVIVKDLSRLGRDHIMTGYYVESFFPENGIRFISMQEGYDNALNQASNDSSTFIFACNDYYSKQNSIKIRNVLNDKRRNGKFIGSAPSYGYLRDPEDKGHLIPDPEYAPIVKKIFEMASDGVGLSDITSYLNDNKIKTPSSLKRKNPNAKNKYNPMWTISSVKKILKNQMYVGDMVQSVQTKVSYKSKKKKTLPKSNWDIVKNTHEALVDRIVFEKVQDNVKRTTRTSNTKREKRLFENLLYCKECGNTLTISYRKNHDYWTINCNRYSRDPRRRMCEPHFIPYDKLEVALLETIKKTCKYYLDAVNVSDIAGEIANKKKNDFKTQERIKELEAKEKEYLNKLDMLYEDRFKGMVSDETYKRIANDTEVLLNKIRSEINKLKDSTKIIKNKTDDLKEYENKIKALIDIENPTRELMKTIIDKIIIDKDKNIEIIYKFSILNNI